MRALLLAIPFALLPTSALAQSRAADEVAIRARVTALEAAINSRDAASYSALFTEDGDAIVLGGAPLQGRAAIRAAMDMAWAATPTRRASITPTSIRFVGSDIAIINTLARFTEGATMTEDRGTWILVRQGATWLVTALRVLPALGA